jgi:hypothetical protein
VLEETSTAIHAKYCGKYLVAVGGGGSSIYVCEQDTPQLLMVLVTSFDR